MADSEFEHDRERVSPAALLDARSTGFRSMTDMMANMRRAVLGTPMGSSLVGEWLLQVRSWGVVSETVRHGAFDDR